MRDNFRGHTEECMKHLIGRFLDAYPKGSQLATKGQRLVAEFCGIKPDTVAGWLYRSDGLPRGEAHIKLLFFIELNGYKVIELEKLPKNIKNFAKLIGYGLISSESATQMLGYKDPSNLFAALKGRRGIPPDREQKLWDMWKVRRDELDKAVEEASKMYRLFKHPDDSESATQLSIVQIATPPVEDKNKPPLPSQEAVIDIMQGLLKLLDTGVLRDLSDIEWATLRGSNVVLGLLSHLSTLSAKLVKQS